MSTKAYYFFKPVLAKNKKRSEFEAIGAEHEGKWRDPIVHMAC